MKNFANTLVEAIDKKKNPSIIGLDSDYSRLPQAVREKFSGLGDPFDAAARSMLEFNKAIIDSIHDVVPAVKIQSAFYEQYGAAGIRALQETVQYAKGKGLIVAGDMKRNDIGNTSKAYSNAYLGTSALPGRSEAAFGLDCVTVNPYLGSDCIKPFLEDCRKYGKGIFVLVKTSNPSSAEIQDIVTGDLKVYEVIAKLVDEWGRNLRGRLDDYSPVGAVVGATYPEDAKRLREMMPHSIFLVPGYGAQGGGARDVLPCFNEDGKGAVIHSARGVIFSYKEAGREDDFAACARDAALRMKKDICDALESAGINPW
jgi:orotidine-5'-phosphate decarboxylase